MAVKTFTTGEVLTAADTNTYLNNGGLVYITGAAFTSATEILLDSVFTATYRNYLLVFDCQTSAGGGILQLQVRAAGSTISTTTYQYQAIDADSTTLSGRRNTAQGSFRFGANDTNGYNSSQVQIFTPQIAIPTRFISSFLRNNGNISEQVWGANTNTTSYDGLRISTTTGNMTGTYGLFGYRIP